MKVIYNNEFNVHIHSTLVPQTTINGNSKTLNKNEFIQLKTLSQISYLNANYCNLILHCNEAPDSKEQTEIHVHVGMNAKRKKN